ncbi:MAG: hypothetical protein Q7V00_01355 [Sulfurimicrobium sp.]|nr:hypothetical protein [Sulfurimicrobium sp.]MDP2200262.1 hypothetical protein [Sulfurimicrobium sp.]MDP3689030.1 hypothetical protein [Sulfurimicrobium sp.]
MSALAHAHWFALVRFPGETVLVNKLTGTAMQVVGGLIVLYSIDSNLGLFRNQSLAATVIAWIRACPIFARSITLSADCTVSCNASASMSATVIRAATTIEERLAALESRIEELRSEVAIQHRAIHSRIEDVRSELSSSIASNQSALRKFSEQVERATVGGFKQQAFGVMLVIYGAITSVFA